MLSWHAFHFASQVAQVLTRMNKDGFIMLQPPSEVPVSLIPLGEQNENDVALVNQIRQVVGEFFGERLMKDREWAKGILVGSEEMQS